MTRRSTSRHLAAKASAESTSSASSATSDPTPSSVRSSTPHPSRCGTTLLQIIPFLFGPLLLTLDSLQPAPFAAGRARGVWWKGYTHTPVCRKHHGFPGVSTQWSRDWLREARGGGTWGGHSPAESLGHMATWPHAHQLHRPVECQGVPHSASGPKGHRQWSVGGRGARRRRGRCGYLETFPDAPPDGWIAWRAHTHPPANGSPRPLIRRPLPPSKGQPANGPTCHCRPVDPVPPFWELLKVPNRVVSSSGIPLRPQALCYLP